ncbi:efflux RND transporter permease subunit [Patescibacteria group bacterium]|nr:efflux RND transporter permease subunit [Patescibacteria group bacterium]
MYNFWSFFIRKKIFSYLVMIALIVFGLVSLITLPKESNPEVDIPIGIVSTGLAGASAADIEKLITNKLEEGIKNNLDNIKKLTSTSREGFSSIVVEFDAKANVDKSIQELKDEVDKIKPELPSEATDPVVLNVDFSSEPVLTFSVSSELPEKVFGAIARQLEEEIKAIRGVSDVSVAGLRSREVQVIVSKESLNTFGINITDVIGAIAATNSTLPAGNIVIDNVKYNVQFEGDINDPSEIADIAILDRGGLPIYVRDIATVIDGFEERTTLSRISIDGEPSRSSLSFNVFKKSGGDITEITGSVQERLEELKAPGELLFGLDTLIIFDTGEFLLKDLKSLSRTGLTTVFLVMFVLFISIGWREALIAGSAIPLSFLIAFIGLSVSGNTLNFVSLFSLILAIGILVDTGIVIVEGINTRLARYGSKVEAAKSTIHEFHTPLTSGTMTTIAVFAPLFFISGIVGEFIKSIPFTVISVLLASLLVALGFIPLIASIFMREHKKSTKLDELQTRYTSKLQNWYRNYLEVFLSSKRRKKIFAYGLVILLVTAVALPISGLVKTEFFGAGDEDFLIAEIELPEGTVLGTTDIEARKLEEILYTQKEIEAFTITVGAGSAFTNGGQNTKIANAFLLLDPDREITSREVMNELRDKLRDVHSSIIRIVQLSDGPPVGKPVVITFFGDDLSLLESVAEDASKILSSISGTSDVTTSTKNDGTQFILKIDKAKATELGLNSNVVSQILRASVNGIEATTIKSASEDIDVLVKLDLNPDFITPHDTNRVNLDALRQIEIHTPKGSILLGSILEPSIAKSNTVIAHEDGKRHSTVESELTENGNTRNIVKEFAKRAKTENLVPLGVTMVVGGENQETDESFADMGKAFVIGIILMFAILVLQFNSFRHAIYTLSVVPTALIGLFFGLLFTGKALSFPSLMGLIALSGIVVNNSIILIDTINHLRINNPLMKHIDAVIEGSVQRLRPILLTTITTIIGIAPLTLATELWAPLAWSVIFGLSFTVFATLLLIPLLYNRKPGTLGNDKKV